MPVMNDNQLHQQLTDVFRSVFKSNNITITSETTAADIAEWDSLNHVQLILAVEAAFGIRFRHAEVASFENVGDMIQAIQRCIMR